MRSPPASLPGAHRPHRQRRPVPRPPPGHRADPLPRGARERDGAATAALAFVLAVLMVLVNLSFWGPLPAGWLWVGAQVQYRSGSVSAALLVAFVGMLLTLMAALAVLKRLDHAWILVRRAAGHDQRRGIVGPIFAVTAAVGAVAFAIWLLFVGGLGPSLAPHAP